MEIKNKKGELLAIVFDFNSAEGSKNFITDNSQDFQIASFNLEKNEEILRHYHPPQPRNLSSTNEVIIVLEGEIEFDIYDEDLSICESGVIKKGNLLALFNGGHGLRMKKDSKFLEVKQGPYDETKDKIRF